MHYIDFVFYPCQWLTRKDFPRKKGAKTRGSLSPLLFILTMEYFSRMMKLASLHADFHLHPSCKKLSLNHLMSADDVLLFCKAHPLTVQLIMQVLKDFHSCSGLQANHSKSVVVFGGCSMGLQSQCLNITGFQEWTFPLRYLGIPITVSKLSKVECRVLVDKIMSKVKQWSSRNLSFLGAPNYSTR